MVMDATGTDTEPDVEVTKHYLVLIWDNEEDAKTAMANAAYFRDADGEALKIFLYLGLVLRDPCGLGNPFLPQKTGEDI